MEVASNFPNAEIGNVLLKPAGPLLVSFECFDVFNDPSGQKLAADRKSVESRSQYRAPDRTLKAEEVDAAHARVLEALTTKAGVKFR
jgi:phenylalanyl-tRNA synthetase beta chain